MCSKKIILAGIASGLLMLVVSLIVGMIVQAVLPYDMFKLGGIRAKEDPLMLLFFANYWVLAFAMAIVYSKLGSAIKGTPMQKGVKFGLIMWLVSSLPSVFIVYTSMNYPIGFSLDSLLGSLIYMPLAGVVIAKIMK